MREICRLCLESTGTYFQNLSVYKELIQSTIPELNYNLTPIPLICDNCSDSLQNAYIFKTCCMDSEERIKNLLNGRDAGNLTLDDLLNRPAVVVKRENVCGVIEELAVQNETIPNEIIIENEIIQDEIIETEIVQDEIDPLGDVEPVEHLQPITVEGNEQFEDGKFRCTMCNLDFMVETNFEIHIRSHTGTAFNCNVCWKGFVDKKEFRKHCEGHSAKKLEEVKRVEEKTSEVETKNGKRNSKSRRKRKGKMKESNGVINGIFGNKRRTRSIANNQRVLLENYDDNNDFLDFVGKRIIQNFLENDSDTETTGHETTECQTTELNHESTVAEANQKGSFECTLCYVKKHTTQEITEHINRHKLGYRKQCEICGDLFETITDLCKHATYQHMPTLSLTKVSNEYTQINHIRQKYIRKNSTRQRTSQTNDRKRKKRRTTQPNKKLSLDASFDKIVDTLCEELHELSTNQSFACEFCKESYKIYEALQEHVKTHFGEAVTRFPSRDSPITYDRAFNDQTDLNRHLNEHIPYDDPDTIERKYNCRLCDKRFRAKRDLTLHYEQHDIVRDIRCEYCHLRFVSVGHHQQHLKNHTYKCEFCNVELESKDAVGEHVVRCKKNPDYIEIIVQGKGGELTCTHCNEVFGGLELLKEHFRMVVLF